MAKTSVMRSESLYDGHPGVATAQKWIAELKELKKAYELDV
jgi:hypothetical protein